jgi:hypothetical protein
MPPEIRLQSKFFFEAPVRPGESGKNARDGGISWVCTPGFMISAAARGRLTGLRRTSAWEENTSSATERCTGGGNRTQTGSTGTGCSAATGVASNLGASPLNSASVREPCGRLLAAHPPSRILNNLARCPWSYLALWAPSKTLRRLATQLRETAIAVAFARSHTTRLIRIVRIGSPDT